MRKIEFTPEQTEEIRAMRRNGKSWDEIGIRFRCSHSTIRLHLKAREPRRMDHTMPRGMRMVDLNRGAPNRPFVPDDRLADRDRRAALADQRDLTSAFFGDPLPGYSAYDARKDFEGSIEEGFRAIRERVANGGPGWEPK